MSIPLEKPVETQEIVTQPRNLGFMHPTSLNEGIRLAEIVSKSDFCPKSMRGKPADVLIVLQMAQELDISVMQGLQNITVINGKPAIYGDLMLAICRRSTLFEEIKEWYEEESVTAFCKVKRKNEEAVVRKFSKADAIRAKLWGKEGPWTQYPERMLMFRARGFALRDTFGDLLKGLISAEEASDMPVKGKIAPRADYSNGSGHIVEGKVADPQIEEPCINENQLEVLKSLIQESASDEMRMCQFLKIDCLESMTVSQWERVCEMLDKKIEKNKPSQNPEDIRAVEEFDREFDGEAQHAT